MHGPRMKSIALNLLGNVADAEDAVQEAFLKVYRAARSFRGRSSFSTWVYRVLVNTCYDVMRRGKRRPKSVPTEENDFAPARGADHPLRLSLEQCLARLRPRHRSVFLLFEVEGFSHREIGEILEVAEGTSKTLLFAAKRELQGMLWSAGAAARASS
jgi:RNA polymerase sigma-70 factor (ECF subfamily)